MTAKSRQKIRGDGQDFEDLWAVTAQRMAEDAGAPLVILDFQRARCVSAWLPGQERPAMQYELLRSQKSILKDFAFYP
jgi:hypothetical protein